MNGVIIPVEELDRANAVLAENAKLRDALREALTARDSAEAALKHLGYQKYGFGWGITIAEPSKATP